MNLLTRLRRPASESRDSFEQYIADVNASMLGSVYPAVQQTYKGRPVERIDGSFEGRVQGAYKDNGVVFACQVARMLLFTEARFMWQQLRAGRPGDLFWTPGLAVLEEPWLNGSTGDLLSRMLQDVDFAGNAYVRRSSPTAGSISFERLRPDWVTIVLGQRPDFVTPQLVGYGYEPEGPGKGDPVFFDVSEVAHWSPIPDPLATYRGMSWLSPIIREVTADSAASDHKLQFFNNAATPNMVVTFDSSKTPEQVARFKDLFDQDHRGFRNAYKTLFLGGGGDATPVGSDFKQMDFKVVQGAGETRIAAAAGVPPVIVGLSEGLQAATYSNYGQARRRFGDMTIRPLWRSACAALSTIVPPVERARLWYDDRDIPALQEDRKDAADIAAVNASTIRTYTDAGYTPESAVAAVTNEDLTLLVHSGLYSVQLQAANSAPMTSGSAP